MPTRLVRIPDSVLSQSKQPTTIKVELLPEQLAALTEKEEEKPNEELKDLVDAVTAVSKDTLSVINSVVSKAFNEMESFQTRSIKQIKDVLDTQVKKQDVLIQAINNIKANELSQLVVNRDDNGFIVTIDIIRK